MTMKNIIILLTTLVGTVMTVDAHAMFGRFANIAKPRLQHRVYSVKNTIDSRVNFSDDYLECAQELEKLIKQNKSTKDPQVTTVKHKRIKNLYEVMVNLLHAKEELQKPVNKLNLSLAKEKFLAAKVTLELLGKNNQKSSLE